MLKIIRLDEFEHQCVKIVVSKGITGLVSSYTYLATYPDGSDWGGVLAFPINRVDILKDVVLLIRSKLRREIKKIEEERHVQQIA